MPAPARGNAEFPTPTARDALELALATFEAGERIDMARIAARLGVGRSTLYRWVGDRDALLGEVLDATVQKIARGSRRRIRRAGLDRVTATLGAYLEAIARNAPLRSLAEREPQVASRLLLDPEGAFAANARAQLQQSLRDDLSGVAVPDQILDALNASNLAVVWAGVVGGHDPQIDQALTLVRAVVGAYSG
jgi:AcrR family transcriptional regulator